jgi:transposase
MQKSNGSRREFSSEFKEEAVRMVTEGGRKVADVARGLGIHENLLYKWKRQYLEAPEGGFPGKGHLKQQDEEFRRIKKENFELRMERDILKKALAIFSKHQK